MNKISEAFALERSSTVARWWWAIRPKTLFASIAPVWLGSALAWRDGSLQAGMAAAALLGAIFIQIGTNLANDYWDARKGADTSERLGPVRVVAAGLLPAGQVLWATWLSFGVAAVAGVFLVWQAGWPILLLGVVSIALGILYTAGPVSLAYLGLGDLFSFLFFGVAATAGTYYVQALQVTPEAWLLGAVPGFYSVALLALNNLRDLPQDRRAGKKTLAVRWGANFTRRQIGLCLLLPPCAGFFLFSIQPAVLLLLIGWFLALPVLLAVERGMEGRAVNALLGRTALAGLLFSFLLGVHLLRL